MSARRPDWATWPLLLLATISLAVAFPPLSAFVSRLYRAHFYPYEDVAGIDASCFDPATDTSWGVYLKGRVVMWRLARGMRDTSGWSTSRVCFLMDAQRSRWLERLEQIGLGAKSMLFERSTYPQDSPARCMLSMSSRGGTYGEIWSRGERPSEGIESFHAELMALGWPPSGFFFDPPPPAALAGLKEWPPVDCEGRPLSGYEDESPLPPEARTP